MRRVPCIHSAVFATAALLAALAAPAWAEDFIPYPNGGTIAPTNIFTAAATGSVDAYYYGSGASDENTVELIDVTSGHNTGAIFDNDTTSPGAGPVSLSVTAGDVLEFVLQDISTARSFSSNPAHSADGVNHAYATAYSADNTQPDYVAGIPAGTFIGMEDTGIDDNSDLNYNDDDFVFTNVASVNATPEPFSFLLMGTGLAAVELLRRRKA